MNNKRNIEDLIATVRQNPVFSRDLSSSAYFAEALSRFKVLEEIPKAYSTFDILEEKFFIVDQEFPRIHRESLVTIPEITSVQYEIDLTSVQPSEEFQSRTEL
jgi:hypothetical protein